MKTNAGRLIWRRYRYLLLALLGLALLFAWMNTGLLNKNAQLDRRYNPTAEEIRTDKDQQDLREHLAQSHETPETFVANRDSVFEPGAQGKFEVAIGQEGRSLGQDIGLVIAVSVMSGLALVVFGKYTHFLEWLRGSGLSNRQTAWSSLGWWLGTFNLAVLINQTIMYFVLKQALPADVIHLSWQNILAFFLLNQVLESLWFVIGMLLGTWLARPIWALFYGLVFVVELNTVRFDGRTDMAQGLSVQTLYSPGQSTGLVLLGGVIVLVLGMWLYVYLSGQVTYAEGSLTVFPQTDYLFIVLLGAIVISSLTSNLSYFSWFGVGVSTIVIGLMLFQAYGNRIQNRLAR
ncbi:hypothetical protein [Lacticaseibacillus brantae]|uniref:Uncharacterized protein n=1 Tax=Lacticaseibacillus brantae DSM 23927 TaxID=1423727 RepID=A0A0R2BA72_9LACO|nr:hypothetical protein [Lacticaseibacillus brantae]KRM72483.1 hypothetical protein FC34_GL000189 [Lacticaseibacillus brantae DSM 23927]